MSCNLMTGHLLLESDAMDLDPIRRISVVSTGTVEIHPEHVGPTRQPMPLWLFTSRRWAAPPPINVYVIEHREGLGVFDTRQDRATVPDPPHFSGGPPRGPFHPPGGVFNRP